MLSLVNNKKQKGLYRNNIAKNSFYKIKETKSENGQHINYLEYCFHLTTLCLSNCLMSNEGRRGERGGVRGRRRGGGEEGKRRGERRGRGGVKGGRRGGREEG